ncbi:membrane protein insertion efficiency factor YidD [Propionivibrio soli]|uniref:membrane protein insertion efficiency factor YidD n=1 Tax=Propionivibrio soli TaxID=2976531 RepID=UPI003B846982
MRRVVLSVIAGYQRYVSPHKGFCCAYRVHTGRKSCSVLGFRAVRRYGVLTGLAILKRRTYLCGVAHRRFSKQHPRGFRSQQGFCDVGCDFPCDIPSLDGCLSLSDFANCCDFGSCDWPSRHKGNQEGEQYVHIPPNVGGRKGGHA